MSATRHMQPMQLVLGSFELPVDLAIRKARSAARFASVACSARRDRPAFRARREDPRAPAGIAPPAGAASPGRHLSRAHRRARTVAQPGNAPARWFFASCSSDWRRSSSQTPTILGGRRHGFRLEVSHPLLELPTIVFGSMEMLSERAHQSRHVLDSRTDGARHHRHHELVGIRIRPRRRTVDRLSWKDREIRRQSRFPPPNEQRGLHRSRAHRRA